MAAHRKPKTAADLYRHARRRAEERLGVPVTISDLKAIAARIAEGRQVGVRFVARQSGFRTLWRVEVKGKPAVVVYNKTLGAIATVLTMDMVAVGTLE